MIVGRAWTQIRQAGGLPFQRQQVLADDDLDTGSIDPYRAVFGSSTSGRGPRQIPSFKPELHMHDQRPQRHRPILKA